jgi:hypothetical protein
MKKLFLLTSIVILTSTFILPFYANAQLPNFTKVDTGAITIKSGGHVSSTCFDMDNDGDLDLLINNYGVYAGGYFSVFKNERNGLFEKIPNFVNNGAYWHLNSLGDFDNDGDLDVFAGGVGANTLKIYSNDGYGNYQYNSTIVLAYSSLYPSLIDLNSDGSLDIIGINRFGSLRYSDGNGGFHASVFLGLLHETLYNILHSISWGDCDNDGDFDAYGGYSTTDNSSGNLSRNACFINNGDGTFVKFDETSVIVDDSTAENASVNWVDYDNDGDMDLYVLNFTLEADGPLSALYENLGDMQFTKHVFEDEMYRNSFTNSSVWGDLDNDADIDLYVSVENNPFPFVEGNPTSATPYNLLFLNDGNGGFTNILDHPLAIEDSHTAIMFDHDNDGDLDVLLTRYSWSNDGHCNLFENQGNDNSWIVITCEGTASNRSAIGARIYAKSLVNGKHITQTREITPVNGHLSCANLRVHFGLGDNDVVDTLIIRWPSGIVDTYLNVAANQFYRAIENEGLQIDFKATNYIQYNPAIANIEFEQGETSTIDLKDHYQFIMGDTVPEINGDTLTFEIINENPNIVAASLNENNLTLEAGDTIGDSKIKIIVLAGSFTERMDSFTVTRGTDDISEYNNWQSVMIFPNPFTTSATIEYELKQPEKVTLRIYNHLGQVVYQAQENQPQGSQQLIWNAERFADGIYYYRILVGDAVANGKMVKVR